MAAETVDVQSLLATSARTAFVCAEAVRAAAFLATHPWWPGLVRMEFGVGLVPVAACYRVRLSAAVGPKADEWLWVVSGSVPSAWFVPDRVHRPEDAVRVYCELARAWFQAVGRRDRRVGVFPFRAPRAGAARSQWAADLARLEGALADPAVRGRDGWIDAAQCTTRELGRSLVPGSMALAGGMLVLDHRGEPGILLQRVERPAADWLAVQRDERFRRLADGPWWKLAPLSGGSLSVPEVLLTVRGLPNEDEIEMALRNANEFGKQGIRAALPGPRAH